MWWAITNIKGAKSLAALMRRHYPQARQVGDSVVCEAERKPWAILAGYMTNSTEIYPASSMKEAIEKAK